MNICIKLLTLSNIIQKQVLDINNSYALILNVHNLAILHCFVFCNKLLNKNLNYYLYCHITKIMLKCIVVLCMIILNFCIFLCIFYIKFLKVEKLFVIINE